MLYTVLCLSEMLLVSLSSVWFGVIFIRHGLYQDGVFKFTVYIPDNYPDGECPVSWIYIVFRINLTEFFNDLMWYVMEYQVMVKVTVLKHFAKGKNGTYSHSFPNFAVSEISIWHPSLPSSGWPCVRRARCQKSFHQMEVHSHHPVTSWACISDEKLPWGLNSLCCVLLDGTTTTSGKSWCMHVQFSTRSIPLNPSTQRLLCCECLSPL